MMEWLSLDTRIVGIAALASIACAMPGTFLVLRRMSMLTHAIAHAVLPGLVLAFVFAGTLDVGVLMVGALVVAVLTSLLIQRLTRWAGMEEGAATGVVFTAMFALGLLLLRIFGDGAHLHLDCVIEGRLTLAATDLVTYLGIELPRATWLLLMVCLGNGVVLWLCWRPLVASVFDEEQAGVQGLSPARMHQVLMVMTSVTTIAAFDAVGSILVVALMVVPPLTALLLADRLVVVLLIAAALGVFTSVTGHVLAIVLPGPVATALLGGELAGGVEQTSTAGMIAVVQGIALALAAWVGHRISPLRGMDKGAETAPGQNPGEGVGPATQA